MQMSPELAIRSPSFIISLNKEKERERSLAITPLPLGLLPANEWMIFLLLLRTLRTICN